MLPSNSRPVEQWLRSRHQADLGRAGKFPVEEAFRGRSARANRLGFTLPELLVALAIFLSVMGGVGLLFVNGLRVMRQGFQNQEAFEQSRNTLKIIERDLSRAFTSRDYGDYYSFYGTPIGFSFVGVVAPALDTDDENLSRVTYVIWHPPSGADIQEPVDIDVSGVKTTYRLLRYIEPGVNTLDDFPVNWYQAGSAGVTDGDATSLGDILDATLNLFPECDNCSGNPTNFGYGQVAASPKLTAILAAKKRELWIRLLSGGDQFIPNGWHEDYQNAGFIELGGTPNIEIPEDYIVCENILYNFVPPDQDLNAIPVVIDGEGTTANQAIVVDPVTLTPTAYFFTYYDMRVGIDGTGQEVVNSIQVRYWNDIRNMEIPGNGLDDDLDGIPDEELAQAGSPLIPRLPQQVATFFTLFFESPYPNAPDFRRRFDQAIDIPTGYRRLKLSE